MNESDENRVHGEMAYTLDALLCSRPSTLTIEHAEACFPILEVDPGWRAAQVSGSAPQRLGPGFLRAVWPEERLSREEAAWILAMREHCSLRTLASFVIGDGNQITGMHLEEAAQRALGDGESASMRSPGADHDA